MKTSAIALAGFGWAAALAASAVGSAAAPRFVSRYTTLADCNPVHAMSSGGYGHAERGADWTLYKCEGKGGGEVWRDYTDGVHMRLGFGTRRNLSGAYNPDRRANWPVEWRGTEQGHAFTPFAAIVRVSRPEDGKRSHLVIFRLRDDGTSCLIGEADRRQENVSARKIADASFDKFKCLAEPFLP